MKIFITRLHVDVWASCCPDIACGAFLKKEDAQKLAKYNFDDYRELWEGMMKLDEVKEDVDDYIIHADHAYFHSYVEELELADNQSNLTQVTGNRIPIYFMRPDVTADKGVALPEITIPYLAFTNEEDALRNLEYYFQQFLAFGQEKEKFQVNNRDVDDKTIYWKGVFAAFFLEETNFVTNLDKYIEDGEKD